MSKLQGKDQEQAQALFKHCVTEEDLNAVFDELALDSLRLRFMWKRAWAEHPLENYRKTIDHLRKVEANDA